VQELHRQAQRRRTNFVARVSPEVTARVADKVELAVDTRRLCFFDKASGEAIRVEGREPAPAR
jgi:hypothetical protein